MDKQKEFLDKVIDHILMKTDIDYDIKQITNWPFYRHGMGFNIFMSAPHSVFGNLKNHFYFYCMEVYALTKEELQYVWEGYINMLGETIKLIGGNINESVDKQKDYLDKVLERLKSETQFKTTTDNGILNYWWKYPFGNFTTLSPYYPRDQSSNFHKHCRDIYGLSNEEIEDYILPNYYKWFKYNNPMFGFSNVETLFKNTTINESVDKQKNFYDKVLDRLVNETNITDSKITFPFANFKQPELSSDSLLSVSTWIDGGWENHKYPSRFKKYCNDIYGVTYEESVILWRRYMEIIEKEVINRLRLIRRQRNLINESMDTHHLKYFIKDLNDKQKNYINKIIEHLVNDTVIDYPLRRIHYPFKDNHTFRNDTFTFSYIYPFSGPFIRYCNDLFPLSKDEMKYVHGMYIANIYKKVSDYFIENDLYHSHYNVNGTKDIISFDQ